MPRSFLHYAYGPGTAATFLLAIPFLQQAIFVGTTVSIVGAAGAHVLRSAKRPVVVPDVVVSRVTG